MRLKYIALFTAILVLSGCARKKSATAEGTPVALQYAKAFSFTVRNDGVKFLTIANTDGSDKSALRFALIPRGQSVGAIPEGYAKITVPIRHCIVMTLPQLSGFVELNALDRVSGMNSARTLQNREVKERISDGRIVQIGMEGNFDRELIIAAQPDVIFISPSKRGGYDVLSDTEVALVPYLGYKESTALGQAEWIKFVALFTGQETQADTYFKALEKRYKDLQQRASTAASRPLVMNGRMLEGLWCAEGGQSVQAQMLHDAGARYVLDDNTATSDIKMEFEEIYAKASEADYWTTLGSQQDMSYTTLLDNDSRYADFKAFRQQHVVFCDIRQSAFRERSPMHPDWLLADFIFAFHPELMPADYQPIFYKLL